MGNNTNVVLHVNKDATNVVIALGTNPVILINGSGGATVTLDSVLITSVTPVAAEERADYGGECVIDTGDDDEAPAAGVASGTIPVASVQSAP